MGKNMKKEIAHSLIKIKKLLFICPVTVFYIIYISFYNFAFTEMFTLRELSFFKLIFVFFKIFVLKMFYLLVKHGQETVGNESMNASKHVKKILTCSLTKSQLLISKKWNLKAL